MSTDNEATTAIAAEGLPSFFQFQGKTVADGLMEFEELGGELEDDNIVIDEEPSFVDPLEYSINEMDINGTSSIADLDIDLDKYISIQRESSLETSKSTNPSNTSVSSSSSVSLSAATTTTAPTTASQQGSNLLKFLKSVKPQDTNEDKPSQVQQPQPEQQQLPQQHQVQNGPPMSFHGPPMPYPFPHPTPFLMAPPPPGFFPGGPMPIPGFPVQFPFPPPGGPVPTPSPMPGGAWARPPPFLPPPRPVSFPPQNAFPPQPPMEYHKPPANPAVDFLRRLPHGSMMRPNDVSYIVRRVLDPMQSADPFADDYYSIQFKIKKNNTVRDEYFASQTNSAPPPLLFIPLPTWKDTKDRIRQQIETVKKQWLDRSRQWEAKEKVLGHNVKSDFTRPKEVLSVPTLSEMFNPDDENMDMSGISKAPYSTRLWNMRQAVQRGYEALYTVQELQYLLDTPMMADSSFNREEILTDIKKAITALAQSLGIRTPLIDEEDSSSSTSITSKGEITLEGGLVAAILQTAKGKRLLSRSFELLPPDYRWALLPAILARVLQVNPSDQAEEDKVVEEKLMKNLLDFIRFAHQYQKELQSKADDKFLEEGGQSSAQFSYYLLGNLRQCLKSVMVTFLDKTQLRQALLSNRSRAEVMHVIVQVGDRVGEDVDAIAASEWVQIRETFMLMLDN